MPDCLRAGELDLDDGQGKICSSLQSVDPTESPLRKVPPFSGRNVKLTVTAICYGDQECMEP
jgi:hypothetical protein